MKLSECVHGAIVVKYDRYDAKTTVGMVVGIGQNAFDEPVPVVQWQNGETYTIHNKYLEIFTD